MTVFKSVIIDNLQLDVAEEDFILQDDFTYGITPANWRAFSALGGSVTGSTSRTLALSTGTTDQAFAALQSFRSVIKRSGQGNIADFSFAISGAVASSKAYAGFLTIGDGAVFGTNGTKQGIMHRHGGVAESKMITVTLAASGATDLTLTLNSIGYTIPLTASTTTQNAREIAVWLNANQSVWTASQNGSTVVIIGTTAGARAGTYSYSHATSTGTITARRTGVAVTEKWYYNDAGEADGDRWNTKLMPDLDMSEYNDYLIIVDNDTRFYVYDNITARYTLVHRLKGANAPADLSTGRMFGNASMRLGASAFSEGSTSNVVLYLQNMAVARISALATTNNPRSLTNTVSVGTTELPILSLRNRMELNGYYNQGEIQLFVVTVSNGANKAATFRLRTNATLTGYNWTYISEGNRISEYDITATATSGGTALKSIVVASEGVRGTLC